MKTFFLLSGIFLFFHIQLHAQEEAPDQLGLPGDNLNLYAVLKIFQESETLEAFERALNDESNNINNLDLDGDNNIDYIQVADNVDGSVHNIVLKVALSEREEQNVAVIVVQRLSNDRADIQIIGDEDLYGKDYVIEPNTTDDNSGETPNPGYTGTSALAVNGSIVVVQHTTTYKIAVWPVIRVIFLPTYIIWRSPWHWHYYPTYWRPWRPHYWHYYYGYHYHWHYYYFGHYRYWPHYRYPNWYNYYYHGSFRSRSPVFYSRYERGDFRKTYSRPDLANKGADYFKKKYPKAPSVNNRLPSFDKNETNRPIVNRPSAKPAQPVARPKPVQRPGTKPVTRPEVTRPSPQPSRPAVTKPAPVQRPETKPVTKPVTKPSQPVTRPAPVQKPVTKPATKPVTRPVTKPVAKPSVTKPAARPAVKPAAKPKPAARPTRQ